MDPDPYKPPEAPLADPTRQPPARGSILKALLTGTAIEVVGTLLVGLAVALVYGAVLAGQGLSSEEVNSALVQMDPLSAAGLVSGLAGTFVSIFAGYACAVRAHRRSYASVAAMSAISLGLGTLGGLDGYAATTLLLLSVLTVAAVMFGGWLYIKDLPPQ